jgi:hypothetical protein
LAPGLGPLLLAAEAQTRFLLVFLGAAAAVTAKIDTGETAGGIDKAYFQAPRLYRQSRPRPKPRQVSTKAVPALLTLQDAGARTSQIRPPTGPSASDKKQINPATRTMAHGSEFLRLVWDTIDTFFME